MLNRPDTDESMALPVYLENMTLAGENVLQLKLDLSEISPLLIARFERTFDRPHRVEVALAAGVEDLNLLSGGTRPRAKFPSPCVSASRLARLKSTAIKVAFGTSSCGYS